MTAPNHRAELAALRVVALEDILNTSDAELRKEAVEDGEDVTAIAAGLKSAMRDAAASALRRALDEAQVHHGEQRRACVEVVVYEANEALLREKVWS